MIKILICFLLLFSVVDAQRYKIVDMGLGDGSNNHPTSINDRGDVVGVMIINGAQKVFLWKKGEGLKTIDAIPDGAYASQINNQRQVIGSYYSWDGWWTPKRMLHGFIWSEADGFWDIGAIDDKHTSAVTINDLSQLILINSENQCYFWENWSYTKMANLSNIVQHVDYQLVCLCLNDHEVVYLKKDLFDKKNPTALYRENLNTHVTEKLPWERREAPYLSCLSPMGKVGGFFIKGGIAEGFLMEGEGKLKTIERFKPLAINDNGVMVGTMLVGVKETAGVYVGDELRNVNELMSLEEQPFVYEEIVSLNGVNRDGWLIGVASCWNTKKGVLLVPVE